MWRREAAKRTKAKRDRREAKRKNRVRERKNEYKVRPMWSANVAIIPVKVRKGAIVICDSEAICSWCGADLNVSCQARVFPRIRSIG